MVTETILLSDDFIHQIAPNTGVERLAGVRRNAQGLAMYQEAADVVTAHNAFKNNRTLDNLNAYWSAVRRIEINEVPIGYFDRVRSFVEKVNGHLLGRGMSPPHPAPLISQPGATIMPTAPASRPYPQRGYMGYPAGSSSNSGLSWSPSQDESNLHRARVQPQHPQPLPPSNTDRPPRPHFSPAAQSPAPPGEQFNANPPGTLRAPYDPLNDLIVDVFREHPEVARSFVENPRPPQRGDRPQSPITVSSSPESGNRPRWHRS
jgi:hypothetical protein